MLREGVVKLLPVNNNVPPLAAEYQRTTAVSVAVSVTLPVPQRLTSEATGVAAVALMIACAATRALGQTDPASA